jgi:hypothetical protein
MAEMQFLTNSAFYALLFPIVPKTAENGNYIFYLL